MTLQHLRVMMVADSLAVGGAERVAVDLANTLDRDQFAVSFCVTRNDGPLREHLADDVDVHVLGRRSTWDVPKMVEFGRLTRRLGVDVVHSHSRGSMRFVALCKVLGLVRARHVFHDHLGLPEADRSAGPALRIPLRRGADHYVGVESALCTWAVDAVGLDPDRVDLVRSGVDLRRFDGVEPVDLRSALGLGNVEVVMVMIANYRSAKDHPTLFRALADLDPATRSRLCLVVVGSTEVDREYYTECMDLLSRRGISTLVHSTGRRDDVPAVLAGADAAAFASKKESGPLVLLEYMASGLPFVATDTGEIARAVRDSGVGIMTTPGDHVELSRALSRILDMSPQERSAMGARGRQMVDEQFDQQVVARQVESIYQSLMESGQERRRAHPLS